MADEDELNDQTEDDLSDDEEEEEDSGGFAAKKIVLFVLLPLLLIGAGGAAAYFTGMLDDVLGIELDCDDVEEGDEHFDECQAITEENHEGVLTPASFYDLGSLTVNVKGSGRQPRFLKISIILELGGNQETDKIEAAKPRIIDHFQTYLREVRQEDIYGSAGLYRLRLELLSRVRSAAPDVDVRDVLFQEILMQ